MYSPGIFKKKKIITLRCSKITLCHLLIVQYCLQYKIGVTTVIQINSTVGGFVEPRTAKHIEVVPSVAGRVTFHGRGDIS